MIQSFIELLDHNKLYKKPGMNDTKKFSPPPRSVAVIGAGAAGLSAAFTLHKHSGWAITLFEKSPRIGGHAQTLFVDDPGGQRLALDIGFMVLNDRTYPCLHQLLHELGLADIGTTEMSFSYQDLKSGFYYGLNFDMQNSFSQKTPGTGPQRTGERTTDTPGSRENLLVLLPQILKFFRRADRDLLEGNLEGISLSDYLTHLKVSPAMAEHYLIPMASGIWSTEPDKMERFSAKAFVQFYKNHGIYDYESPPQWQYLPGGSDRYVQRIVQQLTAEGARIVTEATIHSVQRHATGVTIRLADGAEPVFDKVIFACHADATLAMLAEPTAVETDSLSSWSYQLNPSYVHTDESFMPPADAWASWNYTRVEDNQVSMTYHLNRLQAHVNTDQHYFVTLNPHKPVPAESLIYSIDFKHPVYGLRAFEAQRRLQDIQGRRHSYFCGAYMGYGFHEDAIRSGRQAAEQVIQDLW